MVAQYFMYDGLSSQVNDLVIGSFSGSQDGEVGVGNLSMTTFKSPGSNVFYKVNTTYNNQLQISWSCIKLNCNNPNDIYFTERETANILRWLGHRGYRPLVFLQEGWEGITYNAFLEVQEYQVGGQIVGFNITATCDAPYGWTSQKVSTIISTGTENNPTISDLRDDSDEVGTTCTDMEIIFYEDCNFEIRNLLTGVIMKINNCVAGEQITVKDKRISSNECIDQESETSYAYSGKHQTLYDDFNWKWFNVGNYYDNDFGHSDPRQNKIEVIGNCKVTLKWKEARKAVV